LAHYDPDKIFEALETAAEEWANADYESRLLEELQKSRLAQITLANMGNGKSNVQAEREALASEDYQEYVRGLAAAKRKSIRAKARYDNLKALSDARRTEQASMRELTR